MHCESTRFSTKSGSGELRVGTAGCARATVVAAAIILPPPQRDQELAGLVFAGNTPGALSEPGEGAASACFFPSAPCPGSARRGETYLANRATVNTQNFIPFAKSRSFVLTLIE